MAVLSELLAAGASHWACQLPGASLTCSALDLAAMGGHMEVRGAGMRSVNLARDRLSKCVGMASGSCQFC